MYSPLQCQRHWTTQSIGEWWMEKTGAFTLFTQQLLLCSEIHTAHTDALWPNNFIFTFCYKIFECQKNILRFFASRCSSIKQISCDEKIAFAGEKKSFLKGKKCSGINQNNNNHIVYEWVSEFQFVDLGRMKAIPMASEIIVDCLAGRSFFLFFFFF